jgi:hypothetical protein
MHEDKHKIILVIHLVSFVIFVVKYIYVNMMLKI